MTIKHFQQVYNIQLHNNKNVTIKKQKHVENIFIKFISHTFLKEKVNASLFAFIYFHVSKKCFFYNVKLVVNGSATA